MNTKSKKLVQDGEKKLSEMKSQIAATQLQRMFDDPATNPDTLKKALQEAEKNGVAFSELASFKSAVQRHEQRYQCEKDLRNALYCAERDRLKRAIDAARAAGVDAHILGVG